MSKNINKGQVWVLKSRHTFFSANLYYVVTELNANEMSVDPIADLLENSLLVKVVLLPLGFIEFLLEAVFDL